MPKTKHNYDESKLKKLSSLEHIRLRPGMYIGRMGNGNHTDDGIYVLFKEVVDNGIDEYIMGYGKKIEVRVEDNAVEVRDYGRGIPQGKLVECVTEINFGGKFNDDVFQFSVGMNGVGLKAVNGLSSDFVVTSYRDGKFKRATFASGKLKDQTRGKTSEEDGTSVRFVPDLKLFPKYKFNPNFINRRLWNYAYLNSGLSLHLDGKRIYSRNGLFDLLSEKIEGDSLYEIVHHREVMMEFAFCHTSNFGENY